MINAYQYDPVRRRYFEVSINGAGTSPISTTHDGFTGETVEKKVFLRNDDSGVYYTGIILTPESTDPNILINGSTSGAWIVKLIKGNSRPTAAQWASVPAGRALDFGAIGSSGSADTNYHPFWILIRVPKGVRVQTTNALRLRLNYSETTV